MVLPGDAGADHRLRRRGAVPGLPVRRARSSPSWPRRPACRGTAAGFPVRNLVVTALLTAVLLPGLPAQLLRQGAAELLHPGRGAGGRPGSTTTPGPDSLLVEGSRNYPTQFKNYEKLHLRPDRPGARGVLARAAGRPGRQAGGLAERPALHRRLHPDHPLAEDRRGHPGVDADRLARRGRDRAAPARRSSGSPTTTATPSCSCSPSRRATDETPDAGAGRAAGRPARRRPAGHQPAGGADGVRRRRLPVAARPGLGTEDAPRRPRRHPRPGRRAEHLHDRRRRHRDGGVGLLVARAGASAILAGIALAGFVPARLLADQAGAALRLRIPRFRTAGPSRPAAARSNATRT